MRKPWPRIHADFHGSSFVHCRKAGGGIADVGQSSEEGLLRFLLPVDSAGVGLRVLAREFAPLSVLARFDRLLPCRQSIVPLSSRETRSEEHTSELQSL